MTFYTFFIRCNDFLLIHEFLRTVTCFTHDSMSLLSCIIYGNNGSDLHWDMPSQMASPSHYTLDGDGEADLAVTARIRIGLPRAFKIYDIESSP